VSAGDRGRCLVVSPHPDDAVLSLGATMLGLPARSARATVVTCCAGTPAADVAASWWDTRSGFVRAVDAVGWRRGEDRRACALLGCDVLQLDVPDGPYRTGNWEARLAAELTPLVAAADAVYVPAGVADNPDHELTRRAALRASLQADANVLLYAELPYAVTGPQGELVEGWWASGGAPWRPGRPTIGQVGAADWALKLRAVLEYRSQLVPLGVRFGNFLTYPGPLSSEAVCPLTRLTAGPDGPDTGAG
jgi:LmbE family N-acetylglucosaminyl deacetylase